MDDRRWIVECVGEEAFEELAAGLAGSDLQSVLLEVMQRRAEARTPQEVLSQYQRDLFCAPGSVDLRTSHAIDSEFLGASSGFEAIDLSPVAPLASTSSFAATSQNRVLSALRFTEVTSDPTNVLALECALRLRTAPASEVHLATSQRAVRTQPVPKKAGHTQHFRLFVLSSAGRERKDHAFTG